MKTYTCMKKNVVQWVQDYKEGRMYEESCWCYQYYNWNYASLQSHFLDDLTEEERQSVLDNTFENSDRMRNSHFCVFRMSPDHQEDLLKRFSLLVLGIYLLWSNQRFFLDAVNKSQFGLAFHQNVHQARRRFVEWAQNEIAVVPDFHKRILFSDKAHFWLNGYVNKQNCRIWSEANPQVYVEIPLHPEKLTVWCALWAGGILLQKR
ncbi:DDE superfamily endonuclease [Trichonephila clavipes]|nr:DDE superfamily endonuclease [Trichonephila clavipes]